MSKTIRAYHFVGDTLRDGRPIPADGVKLVFAGQPIMCECGLHASIEPFDALQYAPGSTLCLVECGGIIVCGDNKLVCTERTIVARFDATDLLYEAARSWSLDVAHLLDAPPVVMEYLQTGNAKFRAAAESAAWAAGRLAAESAARAAAFSAAWSAARAAAESAARAAARLAAESAARSAAFSAAESAAESAAKQKQKDDFRHAVEDEFIRMRVEP